VIRDLPNVPGARGVHRLGEGGSVRYDTNLLSLNPARGSGGVSGFPGSTGYPGSGSQPGPRF